MTTIKLPVEMVWKACDEYLAYHNQRLLNEHEREVQAYMDSPTFCDKLLRRKVTREMAEARLNLDTFWNPVMGGYWINVVKDIKMMCEVPGATEITLDTDAVKCLKRYLKEVYNNG